MTVPADRIKAAWQEAQEAFHAMLDANVYGDPAAPETRAYVTAERHLDNLLADAQHEAARAGGNCSCDDCAERVAALWARSA
jgi:hypothetical protein